MENQRLNKTSLALLVIALLCACSGKSETTASTTTTGSIARDMGHITVTGAESINGNYGVTQCMVRRPGKSVISGLSVVFDQGEKLKSAEVNLHAYTHDGTYTIKGDKNVLATAPVTIDFTSKTSLVQSDASRTTIIVKDGGASGSATFTNWQSFDTHKSMSGTLAWQCSTVKKLAI